MLIQKWKKVAKNATSEKMLDMDIYSSTVFRALIKHERYRIDREHGEFSLVVFSIEETEAFKKVLKNIIANVKDKMRLIDEIGWVDDHKVGILLPLTDCEGAGLFVDRLRRDNSAKNVDIEYSIYSYPSSWVPHWEEEGAEGKSAFGNKAKSDSFDLLRIFSMDVPVWKRAFDILVSSAILFCLWPLFLIVAAYIKIVSPGPVFFRQPRVGLKGKTFSFLKFRSMHYGNNQATHMNHIVDRIRSDNPLEKLDAIDPRIIPGGRFLRKSCIDELPQIFLVLRGDMSLVGPRPCLPYEAKEFLRWHSHRFDVLPGMTGLWQVSGKNKLTFQQMIRLDISYARSLSVWNDFVILLRTIPTVIGLVCEPTYLRLKERFFGSKSNETPDMVGDFIGVFGGGKMAFDGMFASGKMVKGTDRACR